jgi:hypothetical protein
MLVQDLLTAAIRSLGVVAAEEVPSTSELTDALSAANDILSSWSPQILPVLPMVREYFALTGLPSYTMGFNGGSLNTQRPVKIEAIAITSSNGARQPARMVTIEEFEARPDTTAHGLFAEVWWQDGGFPLISIFLLPVPAAGGQIEIASYKPLAAFVNLTDTINLAPGYTRALRWALAFEMAPEFGRPVSQELASLAADAKTSITGLNQAILGRPNTVEPPPVPPPVAPQQAA